MKNKKYWQLSVSRDVRTKELAVRGNPDEKRKELAFEDKPR